MSISPVGLKLPAAASFKSVPSSNPTSFKPTASGTHETETSQNSAATPLTEKTLIAMQAQYVTQPITSTTKETTTAKAVQNTIKLGQDWLLIFSSLNKDQ
jgi:hypothetical protein